MKDHFCNEIAVTDSKDCKIPIYWRLLRNKNRNLFAIN